MSMIPSDMPFYCLTSEEQLIKIDGFKSALFHIFSALYSTCQTQSIYKTYLYYNIGRVSNLSRGEWVRQASI